MDAAVIFFLQLCPISTFAPDFEWICEAAVPTGIDTKHFADNHYRMGDGESWYTLDGRRLSSRPTTSGVYIHNQKKVVIK